MSSNNTICTIFGLAVHARKGMRLRIPAIGGGTFGEQIVPIVQGALVRELYHPVGVRRT
jgi:hypothetical protein